MSCDASSVLSTLQAKAMETQEPDVLGTTLVEALTEELPQASWIGIYWLRGQELVLGPFRGPETEHTRIPVGTGVCGTAIATGEDQLVDDVREVENYLACAADVRSEMVVLIQSRGMVVGQIDLDANAVGAFDDDDLCVVRAIADGFGGLIDVQPL
ncbi:MAG: GAF domain-containing protein [Planctomycetota bacterium]|nr:GAF domain-containing protein [Planctomycetota bacterium]